uniref:Uncharacterized protein n=1 Tax=Panagrolaimus sp. ES5 TaxID=591445 RepID=A0AC34F7H5_9BILA
MDSGADLNSNTTKPPKSVLKKRVPPPESECYDEKIVFHYSETSDEDNYALAEETPYLESEMVYKKDGIIVADYRRASIPNNGEKIDEIRKKELDLFYPPDGPNYAKLRYEAGEKFRKEMAEFAWEGSASAQRVSKFQEMRKNIDVQAIRAKYSRHAYRAATAEAPASDEPGCSKTGECSKNTETLSDTNKNAAPEADYDYIPPQKKVRNK